MRTIAGLKLWNPEGCDAGPAVKLGYCDAGLRLKLPPPQTEINNGCGAGLNSFDSEN